MSTKGSFVRTLTALVLSATLLFTLSACGGAVASGDPLLGKTLVIDGARLLGRPNDAPVTFHSVAIDGERILLNFWASWCIPCRDEIPLLAAYERGTAGHAIVVGVLYRDDEGPAARAAAEGGATWPTRRETAITTVMVFVMVAVASLLFLVADQIIRIVITTVLGMGS